ncbi:Cytochrome P450 [Macleaya cordata]|uniref:N-methylcoclaurine 3'-monooxygenase n=1 Tax=Macleaya cordata TaxID=56857 RepID=A0A200RBS5_MACCD|nr:Cytochrome P450 [Macleaya cordata]
MDAVWCEDTICKPLLPSMEIQFLYYPLLLALLLLSFMVIRTRKRSKNKTPHSKLPPGPKKLPLIGNLHHLLGLPHHSLRDLAKKHGPLMHLQLGEVSAIVVSSPKVAKQIMKTHDLNFADRPEIFAAKIMAYNCTDVVFSRYGDYWRQVRKIAVLELLSAKQVRSFRSLREEEVSNLINRISLQAGLPINLSEIIASSTIDITSRAAFGKKCKDKEVFISLMKEVITLAGGFGLEDLFPSLKLLHLIGGMKFKLDRIHKKVDKILDKVIEDHRRNRTSQVKTNSGYFEEDLVDVLLRLQESGELEFPLTTENIKAVIFSFLSLMELHYPSLPVILAFFLFLFMVMKKGIRSKTQNPNSKLPPGPWKLPLIGNLHNMLGLPHRTLRDLAKKYGPLMHLQLGEVCAVVVSSPKVAEQFMKTHDLIFADRPQILAAQIMAYGCTDVAFSPYGNYWRQLRKIFMMELLGTNRVQAFQHIREEEVSNLIHSVSSMAGSPINLSEKISSLTIDIISRAAFGKKCKDKEAFISVMLEVAKLAGGFDLADIFPSLKFLHVITGMKPKLELLHQKVDRTLDDIIKDHKVNRLTTIKTNTSNESEEDLVDVLLHLQESGTLESPITTDNLKAVIWDIFIAGTETSSTTLEWVMSEILKNPWVMKKVQAEVRQVFDGKRRVDETDVNKLDYLRLVIKETLRLHAPAPLLLPRECKERCEIDGYEIPKKAKVIVNAWAIGRDPEYWSDAESFKPERFNGCSVDYKGTNFEYIPFGAGRRMCPGMSFGIANIELPLAQLLYHFDWKLPNGVKLEDLDMSETFGATVRRRNDLYLIPIPYSPLATQKLPFIGNLHQLWLGLPHHTLRDLAKKHGPLMHLQLGEISTVVVSSPKVAKQVLKTHDLNFADRGEILAAKIISYNCTNVAFSPYGDYWRQLRKIFVLELLSAKQVRSFRSIREEEVSNLIQSISSVAGSQVNLSHRIFLFTNDVICRATYGKKCKDKEAFKSSIQEALKLGGGFDVSDVFPSLKFLHVISGIKPKLERLHQKIDRILDNIIKEHRENRKMIETNMGELEEDLVDVLLRVQQNGELEFPITTDNIKAVILDIFSAGTETSSSTTEWAISEMLKKPEVMAKAQAEIRRVLNRNGKVDESEVHELKYLKLVIKETLRLHPSLPLLIPRECRESCEIDEYEIPLKTKVMVNAWAMGRDSECWSDAESFEPERFDGSTVEYKGTNYELIPFGAGRRMCPGMTLGIANIELLLARLLYHFDWKLPNGVKLEDLDMSETFGATFLSFPSFLLLFTLLLLSFMVILKKRKQSKTKNPNSKLLPGPWKLPLIGNLHQLMLGLPHHTLRDLAKKYGPLMHLQLGEVSAIVVSSPKMAKQIMKTHDLIFADRGEVLAAKIMTYNYTDVGFSPYGDYWRQLRKIFVMELLSAKRVQSFQSLREEEVSNLIQNVSLMAGSQINLSDKIFSFTNDITSRAAFGKKCEDKEEFISLMKEVCKLSGGFDVGDIFPSLEFLHVISVNCYLIICYLQDIFIAGTDTSSSTVEWAMAEMMKNPRVMEKAQAEVRRVLNRNRKVDESEIHELKYLKLVIKETLRLHPSLPLLIPRECRESCEIDGYEIPLKTKVMVNAWAIGRDPEYWSNAESFEPERFDGSFIDYKGTNFEYIPFGAEIWPSNMDPLCIFNLVKFLLSSCLRQKWRTKQIMKTHDLIFADRGEVLAAKIMTYNYIDVGFSPYGDYWRQLQKIFVMELLSAKRVQSFRSIREEEVSNLIQNVSLMAGSQINFSQRIFSLTNDEICRAAYGQKCEDKEAFLSSMKEVIELAGGFDIGDLFPSLEFLHVISGMKPKLERLHQKVDRIIENIIKEHRENRTTIKTNMSKLEEDLVDVLLRLQEGGTDTSSSTVEWAMAEMMKKPRVMEKAQAEVRRVLNRSRKVDESEIHELKYLKLVIKETLRLHPSLPLVLPRECRERCEIEGYEIPKKTKVMVNAWAIGRDPEYWSNAESFESERFDGSSIDYKGTNFEYIPFGAGRRMCPGMNFGIANVELLLAQLLCHFDWKLPNGVKPEDLDMYENFGMAVKRKNDLYLIPIPYSPLPVE